MGDAGHDHETLPTTLHLLDGPYVTVAGHRNAVPEGSKRLLVLVALRDGVSRRISADLLWPDVDQRRAAGNLRSAAWRLRCAALPLLCDRGGILRLDPAVQVDVELLCRQTRELVAGRARVDLSSLAAATAALDLLPGWYDDWVAVERERVRTQMLALIEAIAVGLRREHRCAEAIDAALIAVMADPLRETAQRALIAAHVGEGNLGEARVAYQAYRRLLQTEFGIGPSQRLSRLVGLAPTTPAFAAPASGLSRSSTR